MEQAGGAKRARAESSKGIKRLKKKVGSVIKHERDDLCGALSVTMDSWVI